MNDGGPAFPRQLPKGSVTPDEAAEIVKKYSGMSLRDWFAGMALMGGIAGPVDDGTHASAAEEAYLYADAMIAERNKSHA